MIKSEMSIVSRHMQKAPVDLKAIFDELDVRFEFEWMDEASGSIYRDGETFVVTVNDRESQNRQRFTAAHELAHYLLHRDLLLEGTRMHRQTDNLYDGDRKPEGLIIDRSHEIEANRIAAQILMPKGLVKKEHAENPDPAVLASKFGVSKAAMEIRLKTLGLA